MTVLERWNGSNAAACSARVAAMAPIAKPLMRERSFGLTHRSQRGARGAVLESSNVPTRRAVES